MGHGGTASNGSDPISLEPLILSVLGGFRTELLVEIGGTRL